MLSERAELVARLSLKDDFSRRVSGVQKNFSSSMGKIQKTAIQGARTTATNVGKIGATALGFAGLAVTSGLRSLVELEDATTSVDGAIKQVGKGWTTTGQTVSKWANEIEAATEAAFDDKAITAGADNLIRYGKVTEDNLRPALEVMTDLAAKTGSVEGASTLLGKALADPTKAAGKLARQGIILTEAQQDQIKAFEEAGDKAGAQRVLLEALAETTKDAAKASAGPMRDAQNILRDTWEDTTRTLATGALPVLKEVQQLLTEELAKPGTVDRVKRLGEGIAQGLKGLVGIARNVPWQQVGDAMKLAGTGAKAVLDAFTNLPPWVQTAVLSGWGLNKLSGGALGTIVGELGKGLIKGVLGMNAGVVNINAARVNGAGAPAAAGGAGGGLANAAAPLVIGAAAVQAVIDVGTIATGVGNAYKAYEQGDVQGMVTAQKGIFDEVKLFPPGLSQLGQLITGQQQAIVSAEKAAAEKVTTRVESMKGGMVQATKNAADKSTNAAERTRGAIWNSSRSSKAAIIGAGHADKNSITAAIRNNRPIIRINVSMPTIRVSSGTATSSGYKRAQSLYGNKEIPG